MTPRLHPAGRTVGPLPGETVRAEGPVPPGEKHRG
jgi:hypothetical protein